MHAPRLTAAPSDFHDVDLTIAQCFEKCLHLCVDMRLSIDEQPSRVNQHSGAGLSPTNPPSGQMTILTPLRDVCQCGFDTLLSGVFVNLFR